MMEETIRNRLEAAFSGGEIVVRNESSSHAGHAGDDGSGESHWHVSIAYQGFDGMSRVARHRAVHGALGDVMSRIHALSMDLSA